MDAILVMWCLAHRAPIRMTLEVRNMAGWRRVLALWMMQGSLSLGPEPLD